MADDESVAPAADGDEVADDLGADVEAAEAADGAATDASAEEEEEETGLAGIVNGSYWSSFFLVLIGANTVGAAAPAKRAAARWLAVFCGWLCSRASCGCRRYAWHCFGRAPEAESALPQIRSTTSC